LARAVEEEGLGPGGVLRWLGKTAGTFLAADVHVTWRWHIRYRR
jgi:hypothetical protein